VTGAALGMGKVCVEGYIREGVNVVVGDIRVDEIRQLAESPSKDGVKVVPAKCDVTQKADADNLAATALNEFDTIDILVNNAGLDFVKRIIDV